MTPPVAMSYPPLSAKEQRQLDVADRQIARLHVQRQKIIDVADRKIARIKKAWAKQRGVLERQMSRLSASRKYIPDTYPTWEQSNAQLAVLPATLFRRASDLVTFDEIIATLKSARSLPKAFDRLALILGCDKAEICLLQQKQVKRKDTMTAVMYSRCIYNQSFNEAVWATNKAHFNRTLNSRELAWDSPARERSLAILCDHFPIVIDLDSATLFENLATAAHAAHTETFFAALPMPIRVERAAVKLALLADSFTTHMLEATLSVFDGSLFIAYPEGSSFITRAPYLLLRCSVPDGRPRYVLVPSRGGDVLVKAAGNTKTSARLIASYFDTCQTNHVPVLCEETTPDGSEDLLAIVGPRAAKLIHDLELLLGCALRHEEVPCKLCGASITYFDMGGESTGDDTDLDTCDECLDKRDAESLRIGVNKLAAQTAQAETGHHDE